MLKGSSILLVAATANGKVIDMTTLVERQFYSAGSGHLLSVLVVLVITVERQFYSAGSGHIK